LKTAGPLLIQVFAAVHHCRLVLTNLPVVRLCYRAKIASTSVDEVAWLWVA